MNYDKSMLMPFHKDAESPASETYSKLVKNLEKHKPTAVKNVVKEPAHKAKVLSAIYSKSSPTKRRSIDSAVKNKAFHVTADTTYHKNKSIESITHKLLGVDRGNSFTAGEGRAYFPSQKMNIPKAKVEHNKMIKTQPGTIGTSESAPSDSTYLAKFKKTGS